jgi:hypothetical protein
VVVREQQAGEDKRAGEPADDEVHFHIMCVIWIYSMKTGRKQHAENCAVNRADDGIAGERTGACGTADEFIPAEAEPGSNYCSDENTQDHGLSFHWII